MIRYKMRIMRLHDAAIMPTRGSPYSAGLDLYAVDYVILPKHTRVTMRTGIAIELPRGYYGAICPRSGLAHRNGVQVLGGIIDQDYRGEVMVILHNSGEDPVTIQPGYRIAQLIVQAYVEAVPEWSTDLRPTDRGDGGLGSTGA
jgi:dUTP pyrophosphatase